VAQLSDKAPDVLPRSELNPLTNPALERNLSRWAEVYFGTPPGKRDQAISKLLQEIRLETLGTLKAESARSEGGLARSAELQEVACPSCRQQNPLGYKFCRECGAALHPGQPDAASDTNLAEARAAAEAPAARSESDVQWLRDRALGSLSAYENPVHRGWMFAVGGFVIVLAGFVYLQWAPLLQTGASHNPVASRVSAASATAPLESASSTPAPSPQETISPLSQPSEVKSGEVKLSDVNPSEAKPGFVTETPDRDKASHSVQPAAQKSSLLPAAPMPSSGESDLRLAQRYLSGSMGARDSSEAARLLWKAVRQQNTTAAVLLSDLYVRGDGVPKSCDQARLLLLAATKRGAPQAAEQLRSLESHGCR
jgi:TPR repeat protein